MSDFDSSEFLRTFAQFFPGITMPGTKQHKLVKFAQYNLRLQGLPAGKHHYDMTMGKEFFVNMENLDIHNADLKVGVDVDVRGGEYLITMKIDGTVTLLCDRCLDTLVWPVDTEYSLTVRFGESYDDSTDDVLVIPASDPALNLAYLLNDTVTLSLPMRHVHPAGQCNRAMTQKLHSHRVNHIDNEEEMSDEELSDVTRDEAEDAATDPRWDALKGLSTNTDNDAE